MAGRGPTPNPDRVRRPDPERGEFVPPPAPSWRHGPIPDLPDGLMQPSADAWAAWFSAWFSAYWEPSDLPGLRQIIRLYDQVERGEFQRSTELRLMMDTYGITPKGQQDRRWKPLIVEPAKVRGSAYAHLKVV